ncbi:tail protein X [Methylobacterium sp. NFXW15]|uniref:tail protein X n=1 Tax=Methylobacterium sp. NFXW15 TaxID=2819512 RepID=UPI003CEA81E4
MGETVTVAVPEEIRLDRAAKRWCGTEQEGNVNRLLALNPGLATLGGFVPEGFRLRVPRPAPEDRLRVQLSINPWE